MDKIQRNFRAFTFVFYAYVICLAIPFLDINLSGGQSGLWLLVFAASHLAYLFLLGSLISASKRSAIKWVILSIATGPIGILASFLLIKPIAIEQGWQLKAKEVKKQD
jgi:hypothetical protein